MKRSDKPLGNLPMEIMAYLSAYFENVSNNGQMKSTVIGGQVSKFPLLIHCPTPLLASGAYTNDV